MYIYVFLSQPIDFFSFSFLLDCAVDTTYTFTFTTTDTLKVSGAFLSTLDSLAERYKSELSLNECLKYAYHHSFIRISFEIEIII